MEALSLLELNALVRRSLEQCLPDEYWVQAELSDVRTNSTGHCYLEFIQKDPRSNGLVAKARGTIWSNVYRLLKPYFEEATGQAFVSGIKVLVQVTVSFHELYGYSLTVQDSDRVEESVLAALDLILSRQNDFDAVVIIRGGGATSDLSGFDTYLLAAACAQFPLPIITGIGHERDDTVLDSVAHTRVKTPTAAAEYLINCMDLAADELEVLITQLHDSVISRLTEEHRRLALYRNRIPSAAVRRVSDAKLALLTARKDISQAVTTSLSRQQHRLDLLRQRLVDASPEKMLARGYSITLKDGKVVKDATLLNEKDEILTRFYRGEVTSVVNHKS